MFGDIVQICDVKVKDRHTGLWYTFVKEITKGNNVKLYLSARRTEKREKVRVCIGNPQRLKIFDIDDLALQDDF